MSTITSGSTLDRPKEVRNDHRIQKIMPFLWFDGKAEEAARFYTSVFSNSRIDTVTPMAVAFELDGLKFVALNGGPEYKFTEAVSFLVSCETQQEIDYFWERLSAGGSQSRCGWLNDRFGLSWQIVPPVLPKMLNDKDHEKAHRVMEAMMGMGKIEIQVLERAYHQSGVGR